MLRDLRWNPPLLNLWRRKKNLSRVNTISTMQRKLTDPIQFKMTGFIMFIVIICLITKIAIVFTTFSSKVIRLKELTIQRNPLYMIIQRKWPDLHFCQSLRSHNMGICIAILSLVWSKCAPNLIWLFAPKNLDPGRDKCHHGRGLKILGMGVGHTVSWSVLRWHCQLLS